MTLEQLRQVHRAQPFVPFTLHLADGRKIYVRSPEFLALSPGGRIIAVATGENVLDRIDLLLVVSIETDEGRRGRNGRSRKAG
jgi:hypothetical protein